MLTAGRPAANTFIQVALAEQVTAGGPAKPVGVTTDQDGYFLIQSTALGPSKARLLYEIMDLALEDLSLRSAGQGAGRVSATPWRLASTSRCGRLADQSRQSTASAWRKSRG